MSDDIVARLRVCTCVPHGELCREAADEIERLRDQLRLANIDNFETTAEIERLRAENATFRRKLDDLELNCQHSTALVAHYVRKVERLESRNAVQE